ncbi:hypothetical protein JKP88DRAFT_184906 [Tribonema minus]|uniref:Dynein light chain roadblock n=1 Tax=Tribonema minus TaxID=303371 RepID=A0A836CIL5_9STRA|nr:hypothetical protein JKP88DRAFT_184906 [Tribonema minus]|eukprot:TRINITY_DN10279_c0_g1_i1.p2 TRINITY_DN10279_c0_g1~~TRINITY_DN10279_c0_g1_i1.p2  ORF type:complete len:103 (-),score=41.49 TRINITY_DN10279_c0_g1_i1:178-486(-)
MAQVEETLERIKVQPGVEGYVICDMQGQVLRRFPTMSQETAEMYAASMMHLAHKARGVVRDLNPKSELNYLRIRAKRHEVMVAFDKEFLAIVIQRWQPAGTS